MRPLCYSELLAEEMKDIEKYILNKDFQLTLFIFHVLREALNTKPLLFAVN